MQEKPTAREQELEDKLDAVFETIAKVTTYLGIDSLKARKAPGKPSDVIIAAIEAKVQAEVQLRLQEMKEKMKTVGRVAPASDGYPWKQLEYRYSSDLADLPEGTRVYHIPAELEPELLSHEIY